MTREEILRRIDDIDVLIKEQESKKTTALILLIVMVVIFWPLLFIFLISMNKAEAEISRLNKEKKELEAMLNNSNSSNVVYEESIASEPYEDLTTKLKELHQLYEDDVISEGEYQDLKAEILKKF